MADDDPPAEFRERIYSRKHTLDQLRMKIQKLSTKQQSEALLGVFADASAFQDQEIAGELLMAVHPKCQRQLADTLRSIVSTWNASVEQLPFYLRDTYGRDEVIRVATQLETEYQKQSREAQALRTIRWWLR